MTGGTRVIVLCATLAGLDLIEMHGPEGQRVLVNPATVTSIRAPLKAGDKFLPRGTRCVVLMTNSRIIAVREDCEAVRAALERTHE